MYGGQYALMGNQQAQDAPQHFPGLYPPQSIPQIGYGEQWPGQQSLAQDANASYHGAQMQGMMGRLPAQHGYGPPAGYQGMTATAAQQWASAYVPESPVARPGPQQGIASAGHGLHAATHHVPSAAERAAPPPEQPTVQQVHDGLAAHEEEDEGNQWRGFSSNRVLFLLTCQDNEIQFTVEDVVKSLRSALGLGSVPRDQIFSAMLKGGRTGPYVVASTPAAREFIMTFADTVTIFKSGSDGEAEFQVTATFYTPPQSGAGPDPQI